MLGRGQTPPKRSPTASRSPGTGPPQLAELSEPVRCRRFGRRRVDRRRSRASAAQAFRDETVPKQVDNTYLGDRERPCGGDIIGHPVNPSHTTMQTSLTPQFLFQSRLAASISPLSAGAGPQPPDVALAIDADPDHGVDGPVRHLSVANFDHDAVDEDHRVGMVDRALVPTAQRAVRPAHRGSSPPRPSPAPTLLHSLCPLPAGHRPTLPNGPARRSARPCSVAILAKGIRWTSDPDGKSGISDV